jgi:hypothetical protein
MTEEASIAEVMVQTQCAGKDPFDTFALAKAVAVKTKRDKHKANIRVYHCPHCHKYHIGSKFIFKRERPPKLTKKRR